MVYDNEQHQIGWKNYDCKYPSTINCKFISMRKWKMLFVAPLYNSSIWVNNCSITHQGIVTNKPNCCRPGHHGSRGALWCIVELFCLYTLFLYFPSKYERNYSKSGICCSPEMLETLCFFRFEAWWPNAGFHKPHQQLLVGAWDNWVINFPMMFGEEILQFSELNF